MLLQSREREKENQRKYMPSCKNRSLTREENMAVIHPVNDGMT
jgi:hypothetical protein